MRKALYPVGLKRIKLAEMTNKSTLYRFFSSPFADTTTNAQSHKIHVLLFIYCNDKSDINIEMRQAYQSQVKH